VKTDVDKLNQKKKIVFATLHYRTPFFPRHTLSTFSRFRLFSKEMKGNSIVEGW